MSFGGTVLVGVKTELDVVEAVLDGVKTEEGGQWSLQSQRELCPADEQIADGNSSLRSAKYNVRSASIQKCSQRSVDGAAYTIDW